VIHSYIYTLFSLIGGRKLFHNEGKHWSVSFVARVVLNTVLHVLDFLAHVFSEFAEMVLLG